MTGTEGFRRRPGLGILVPAVRLPGDYARADALRDLARAGVAGFIVFGGDEELLPAFLDSLRDAAGRPLLFMTDAERGMGQQVQGCVELPPLMGVGATLSEERAYQHGRATALEARRVGINVVLGPVADVLSRPTNPIIGNRSFGSNPELVARMVAAWIEGAQDQGVLACAKHFPGHGDTSADSHSELPVVDAPRHLLDARELAPFRAAVAAGVGAVMTAHVAYPALTGRADLPATLSPDLLGGLLRDAMGFGGLVVSDSLDMRGLLGPDGPDEPRAAVLATAAGCDLLLHPTDPYAVADALEKADVEGEIDLLSLQGRLHLTLSDLAVGAPDPQEIEAEHLYGAYGLARDSLTVLRNDRRLLPLVGHHERGVFGLIVDDDDDARLEDVFRERHGEFPGGFVRCTDWKDDAHDGALPKIAASCDLLLLAVSCAARAYKGRAGLKPSLVTLVDRVLRDAGDRTVTLLLGAPGSISGLAAPPATLVAAWGRAPVCLTAALDAILTGTPLRGVDPAPEGP